MGITLERRPRLFAWTKAVDDIITKVKRGRATLNRVIQPATHDYVVEMGDSRIEAHRHVDAPAEVLYDLISDLPRMAEWSPENCSGRWLTHTGPVVGARLKGSNRRKGLRWSTVATVTVAEPARHFEFVISIGPAKRLVTWGYDLEPDGSGTLVTEYHIDHRPGWVVVADRSISRLESCDAHHQANMETTLAHLAAAAENRTSG